MEYPRAWEARITYTDSGETEVIQTGEHADALPMSWRIWRKPSVGMQNACIWIIQKM